MLCICERAKTGDLRNCEIDCLRCVSLCRTFSGVSKSCKVMSETRNWIVSQIALQTFRKHDVREGREGGDFFREVKAILLYYSQLGFSKLVTFVWVPCFVCFQVSTLSFSSLGR